MVEMVERMLALHERKAEASGGEAARLAEAIAAMDKQIDALVVELYGLTEEEVRIVEGSVS
jgi:dihydrodipicolinate reductase